MTPGGRETARLRRAAARILAAGLQAADPTALVARNLELRANVLKVAGRRHRLGRGRLVMVAAGKAAGAMARAAERILGGRLDAAIAVASAPGPPLGLGPLRVAGHPIPDARGAAVTEEIEALARGLDRRDLLLVLLSGGASALLPAPAAGISLEDKASVTASLLRAGATIAELNGVRKHLSRLKGGGLAAAAAPARVECLALSDVIGDDPATIGSGLTAPDPTTFAEALEVLRARGVLSSAPAAVRRRLEAGARGELPETPKPSDPLFRRVTTSVIGSNRLSLEAAARAGRGEGFAVRVLTTCLAGEAREVARVLVSILNQAATTGARDRPAACLLAGGETTVTVRGAGHGGRNQELVLAAAESLRGFPAPAVVASLATDGVDGHSDAAGGVADQWSHARGQALGLPPIADFLERNDSNAFLGCLGDLILTGPTGTNVMDLTILLAGRRFPRL